jgi:archaellum component FlaF (FlaF/FlaG flagellin family)
LRFRKARRKLIADSRGFSSVVGAVFAVLVMISLISTVFVWSLSQNTLYNNTVTQTRQADLDRSNEKVLANVTCIRVDSSTVSVNGTVENDGSLSAQIVTLWVLDANTTTYGFKSLNITLTPGNITTLSGPTYNVPLANSVNDSLSCWFITGRGNPISEKSVSPTIINNYSNGTGIPPYAMVAGGIGSISMDFKSFRSYKVTSNSTGDFLGPERESFYVTISENTAFSIKVINLDLSGDDIYLIRGSLFWVVSPPVGGGAIKGEGWRLATIANGKISPLGAGSVPLPYNQTATIYFGPDYVSNSNIQPGGIVTNLLLVGTIGTKNYGQNLPFISLIAQLS